MSPMTRFAVISIHDIAPATLDAATRIREMVREVAGDGPVSLLIVPEYHQNPSWPFEATTWVTDQVGAGDESVLHGFAHCRPDGRDGVEFTPSLRLEEVTERIAHGPARLAEFGLHPQGFIAPAYGHPAILNDALRTHGLTWWATRYHLTTACESLLLPSIGLGASTHIRRWTSPTAAGIAECALGRTRAIRLDLHPADLSYRRLRTAALRRLDAIARHRRLVTHRNLLDINSEQE